ncbi:MAG TPA: dTMP kinase [Solirubrobacteraceae bacterium]|jgi:dTMP kinase
MSAGKLITIEGLDGVGKTTLIGTLVQSIRLAGVASVESLREPGGVGLSERVRELVKDPSLQVGARAEALLYAAARAQLVQELVRPLLQEGTWVLLDRFVDSSLAYQGAGRSLGFPAIEAINQFATGELTADRTLLLRAKLATGRSRQHERSDEPDRLEREDEAFFARIAAAYEQLAHAEPQRIRVLDAERPAAEVAEQALSALEDLFREARDGRE